MTEEQFERLFKVLCNIAGSLTILAVVSIPITINFAIYCYNVLKSIH